MFSKLFKPSFVSFVKPQSQWKKPVRVSITGANGNIGYATLFRIANGDMLGHNQPIILHLIDLKDFQKGLQGVKMELNDCAFPLLQDVVTTEDLKVGFKDVDYNLLIGAFPRGKGMERADLLKKNSQIFKDQGLALNDHASRNCKTIVIGNPANTNCLILSHFAKDIPKKNFTCMTRLDHNRALYQLSQQLKCGIQDIKQFCVWGNHSPTMFPDTTYVTLNQKNIHEHLDKNWREKEFIPRVQQRGTEVINTRGASSAASAGNAGIDHMRDWILGTNGLWTSMGIISNGEYGISKGLVYSYPVICEKGEWKIVEGLKISEDQRKYMQITEKDLSTERDMVQNILN